MYWHKNYFIKTDKRSPEMWWRVLRLGQAGNPHTLRPERVRRGTHSLKLKKSKLELSGITIVSEVLIHPMAFQKIARGIWSPNLILQFPYSFFLVTSLVKHIGKGAVGALHEGTSEAQDSKGENWQRNPEPTEPTKLRTRQSHRTMCVLYSELNMLVDGLRVKLHL